MHALTAKQLWQEPPVEGKFVCVEGLVCLVNGKNYPSDREEPLKTITLEQNIRCQIIGGLDFNRVAVLPGKDRFKIIGTSTGLDQNGGIGLRDCYIIGQVRQEFYQDRVVTVGAGNN